MENLHIHGNFHIHEQNLYIHGKSPNTCKQNIHIHRKSPYTWKQKFLLVMLNPSNGLQNTRLHWND